MVFLPARFQKEGWNGVREFDVTKRFFVVEWIGNHASSCLGKIPPQHGKNVIIIYDIPKPTIKNPPNVEEKHRKRNMTTKNLASKISPNQEKKITQQLQASIVVLSAVIPSNAHPALGGRPAFHGHSQASTILIAPAPLGTSRHAQADDGGPELGNHLGLIASESPKLIRWHKSAIDFVDNIRSINHQENHY